MEKTEERLTLAALQSVRGMGPESLMGAVRALGSGEAVWRADPATLARAGLPPKVVQQLTRLRQRRPDLPAEIGQAAARAGIKLVTLGEPGYPAPLETIYHPPVVLFYRGTLAADALRIGMVGARRFSRYGEGIAEEMGERLAAAGVTVVSGAARGIDSASHRGALKSGRTVAVLGCGADVAYPAENRRLLAEIVSQGGAVVSEYLPGTPPLPAFFPARNRIISGLSRGIVVVEAAEKSGSLITAELALSEGRDIFAVPGSIFSPTSAGCHRLIQQGAKLVTSAADVLADYGLTPPVKKKKRPPVLKGAERKVYQVLSYEYPLSTEEILASLGESDAASLTVTLLSLSLKGVVIQNESHGYLRAERE